MNGVRQYDSQSLSAIAEKNVEDLGVYIGWQLLVEYGKASLVVHYKRTNGWADPKLHQRKELKITL